MIKNAKLVLILLRLSLASVYLYAAIGSLIHPTDWLGFFPLFLVKMFPAPVLTYGFSGYEILLSVWILSGWKSLYSGILSALTIAGILIFNLNSLDILFRDFTMLFVSLALAISDYKRN